MIVKASTFYITRFRIGFKYFLPQAVFLKNFRKDAPGVDGGLDDNSMSLTKLPLRLDFFFFVDYLLD